MPGDRVITLTVRSPSGRNEYGEYVAGMVLLQRHEWAWRLDTNLEYDGEPFGNREASERTYRVRFLDILDRALTDNVTVWDAGYSRKVLRKGEVPARDQSSRNRRRYIDLVTAVERPETITDDPVEV